MLVIFPPEEAVRSATADSGLAGGGREPGGLGGTDEMEPFKGMLIVKAVSRVSANRGVEDPEVVDLRVHVVEEAIDQESLDRAQDPLELDSAYRRVAIVSAVEGGARELADLEGIVLGPEEGQIETRASVEEVEVVLEGELVVPHLLCAVGTVEFRGQ